MPCIETAQNNRALLHEQDKKFGVRFRGGAKSGKAKRRFPEAQLFPHLSRSQGNRFKLSQPEKGRFDERLILNRDVTRANSSIFHDFMKRLKYVLLGLLLGVGGFWFTSSTFTPRPHQNPDLESNPSDNPADQITARYEERLQIKSNELGQAKSQLQELHKLRAEVAELRKAQAGADQKKQRDSTLADRSKSLPKQANITVRGFVRGPGKWQVAPGTTLLEAIQRAGGLTGENPEWIIVRRPSIPITYSFAWNEITAGTVPFEFKDGDDVFAGDTLALNKQRVSDAASLAEKIYRDSVR
jgi:hypothetical protein